MPKYVLIAGVNGAGKSTLYHKRENKNGNSVNNLTKCLANAIQRITKPRHTELNFATLENISLLKIVPQVED